VTAERSPAVVPAIGAAPEAIAAAEWQAAAALVGRSRRVLLCTHKKPDGDAIGSVLGLGLALEHAGKEVTLVCQDPPANGLATLPGAERIITAIPAAPASDEWPEPLPAVAPDGRAAGQSEPRAAAIDGQAAGQSEPPPDGQGGEPVAVVAPNGQLPWELIITVDASSLERLGTPYEANRALFEQLPIVNIDHHITNDRFGTANLVDPGAAAASEVVARLLEHLGLDPDVSVATCLLAGMITDSLSFQTESVTPRTLRTAAALVEAGAPLAALATRLLRQRPRSSALLWSRALSTLQFAAGGRIAWIEVTREMKAASGTTADSAGLSGFAANIEGVVAGMLVEEGDDGNIYVGLRSATLDVAQIAAQFGGGGHQRAAGCHFPPPTTLAEAREALLHALEAALPASSRAMLE